MRQKIDMRDVRKHARFHVNVIRSDRVLRLRFKDRTTYYVLGGGKNNKSNSESLKDLK